MPLLLQIDNDPSAGQFPLRMMPARRRPEMARTIDGSLASRVEDLGEVAGRNWRV